MPEECDKFFVPDTALNSLDGAFDAYKDLSMARSPCDARKGETGIARPIFDVGPERLKSGVVSSRREHQAVAPTPQMSLAEFTPLLPRSQHKIFRQSGERDLRAALARYCDAALRFSIGLAPFWKIT